jgi:hypothetical protein
MSVLTFSLGLQTRRTSDDDDDDDDASGIARKMHAILHPPRASTNFCAKSALQGKEESHLAEQLLSCALQRRVHLRYENLHTYTLRTCGWDVQRASIHHHTASYTRVSPGCVNGNNVIKHSGKFLY